MAEPGRHVGTNGGNDHDQQERRDPVLPEQGDHREDQQLQEDRDTLSHKQPGAGGGDLERHQGRASDDRREEKREETGVINVKHMTAKKGAKGHEVGGAKDDADCSAGWDCSGRIRKEEGSERRHRGWPG